MTPAASRHPVSITEMRCTAMPEVSATCRSCPQHTELTQAAPLPVASPDSMCRYAEACFDDPAASQAPPSSAILPAQDPPCVPFVSGGSAQPMRVPYWVPVERAHAAEAARNSVTLPAAGDPPAAQDTPPAPADAPLPPPPPIHCTERHNLVDITVSTSPVRRCGCGRRWLPAVAAALFLLLAFLALAALHMLGG